jgi:hypothetical protein
MRKIIDCFLFDDKYEIIKFRFEELYHKINHFVLIDDEKKYDKIKYVKYHHKIILTEFCNLVNVLKELHLDDSDIVLFSEYNHVPNKNIFNIDITENYRLEQDLYYYNFTHKSKNFVYDANIINYGSLKEINTIESFCDFYSFGKHTRILKNGGWALKYFCNDKTKYTEEYDHIEIHKNNNLPQKYKLLLFTNENDLTKYGIKYHTDKAYWHLYTDFYYEHFRNIRYNKINILEIGIGLGSSLLMLYDFFPNANIYGIDIEDKKYVQSFDKDRIKTFVCNQNDRNDLQKFIDECCAEFNIIFDNGSHVVHDQLVSLGFLFKYIKSDGMYICESIQTSLDYVPFDNSVLHMLRTKFIGGFLLDDEAEYLNENIKDIKIHEKSRNPLICYHCGDYILKNDKFCECGAIIDPSLSKSITVLITKS